MKSKTPTPCLCIIDTQLMLVSLPLQGCISKDLKTFLLSFYPSYIPLHQWQLAERSRGPGLNTGLHTVLNTLSTAVGTCRVLQSPRDWFTSVALSFCPHHEGCQPLYWCSSATFFRQNFLPVYHWPCVFFKPFSGLNLKSSCLSIKGCHANGFQYVSSSKRLPTCILIQISPFKSVFLDVNWKFQSELTHTTSNAT